MDALILVDLQNGLCRPETATPLSEAVRAGNALSAARDCLMAARAAALEVVHVRLAFDDGYRLRTNRTARFDDHELAGRFRQGSATVELCKETRPKAEELVMNKGSVSPFASTLLLEVLRARGITHIALAGVATHLAIESAAREAADRGLHVTIIGDACTAPESLHRHAISATLPAFAEITTSSAYVSSTAAN